MLPVVSDPAIVLREVRKERKSAYNEERGSPRKKSAFACSFNGPNFTTAALSMREMDTMEGKFWGHKLHINIDESKGTIFFVLLLHFF